MCLTSGTRCDAVERPAIGLGADLLAAPRLPSARNEGRWTNHVQPASIALPAFPTRWAGNSEKPPLIGLTRLLVTNHVRARARARTPNAERRTPNAERRTPNAERRTPNAKRLVRADAPERSRSAKYTAYPGNRQVEASPFPIRILIGRRFLSY